MNLHQFRFVQEAVRRNLNLTETAKALYTSQPGVSKAILELEEELGVDIFARHGKRLQARHRAGPAGAEVGRDHHARGRQPQAHRRGVLQAGRRHPVDRDHAHAGALRPARAGGAAAQALPEGAASCCTRACPSRWRACCWTTSPRSAWPPNRWRRIDELVTLPCYEWQHVLVVPRRPPAGRRRAADAGAAGRRAAGAATTPPSPAARASTQAFARAGSSRRSRWRPSTPTSSRPMCGWGWAWASSPRWRCATTRPSGDLVARPLGHLFGSNVTRVAFKRGAYLRQFVYAFAELLSDRADPRADQRAMARRAPTLTDYRHLLTHTA